MKTIFKYPLRMDVSIVVLDVPDGAHFIYVAEQHEKVCLWAFVDSEAPLVRRMIRIVGTGLSAEDVKIERYIGSVLTLNGALVFHIFDAGYLIQ